MQNYRLVLCLLLAVAQPNTLLASPPQRLIIQFDTSLTAEQQHTFNQQLRSILQTDFSVLPHSTAQKWIITIPSPLDDVSLKKANDAITRLEHVKYVEPDQLMQLLH